MFDTLWIGRSRDVLFQISVWLAPKRINRVFLGVRVSFWELSHENKDNLEGLRAL